MKQVLSFASLLFFSMSLTIAGSLRGVVRDTRTNLPIDTVQVTVHIVNPDSIAIPTKTDQNGEYSITGINPDNKIYVVMTYRIGYIYSYTRIDNLGALDLVYDIYLTAEATPPIPPPSSSDSSTVFGMVMAPSNQSSAFIPVANVQVGLTSGSQHLDITTNAEGKYAANIPLGRYSVSIAANGYQNLTVSNLMVQSTGTSLNIILKSTGTGVETGSGQSLPGKFLLSDGYPNPFNPSSTIQFSLPELGFATLKVYNTLGHEVAALASGEFEGGREHRVTFDASNLASGVYFSRLEYNNQGIVRKLVLVK